MHYFDNNTDILKIATGNPFFKISFGIKPLHKNVYVRKQQSGQTILELSIFESLEKNGVFGQPSNTNVVTLVK